MKAVIFDMDGLMIDSERVTFRCCRKALQPMGLDMSEDFYKQMLGRSQTEVLGLYQRNYGEDFPYESYITETFVYLKDYYNAHGVPVKKGLTDLLTALKAHDIKCAVASSSPRERVSDTLTRAGVIAFFDAMVCGDEVKRSKPDPEIFLTACTKLSVSPQDALVLEDSENGILCAHRAGIPVICVPDMKVPAKEFADLTDGVLDSLRDVKARLFPGT